MCPRTHIRSSHCVKTNVNTTINPLQILDTGRYIWQYWHHFRFLPVQPVSHCSPLGEEISLVCRVHQSLHLCPVYGCYETADLWWLLLCHWPKEKEGKKPYSPSAHFYFISYYSSINRVPYRSTLSNRCTPFWGGDAYQVFCSTLSQCHRMKRRSTCTIQWYLPGGSGQREW